MSRYFKLILTDENEQLAPIHEWRIGIINSDTDCESAYQPDVPNAGEIMQIIEDAIDGKI